jgi:enamine deaminase RidA (YjgF/YER057c/UK114 family)
MTKQFLNLDGHKPPGYTHVVTSPPGKMIFISGRGGAAADGTMPRDFGTQVKNTFEDLKRCLAMAGASFKDVVKINYFVTDLSKTTELRQIRAQYLDMEHPPAAVSKTVLHNGGPKQDSELRHVDLSGIRDGDAVGSAGGLLLDCSSEETELRKNFDQQRWLDTSSPLMQQ